MEKRKKIHIDEYEPASGQAKKPILEHHTDFGENAKPKNITIPIANVYPSVQRAFNPPLKSTSSPTPRLDWVLQASGDLHYHIDTDIDLEELATCEIEALGLLKYMETRESATTVQNDATKPKNQSSDPMLFWIPKIDTYVDELLRLEGRGDANHDTCAGLSCSMSLENGSFRCKDCHSVLLFCQRCIVSTHISNPLHRIERWDNGFFRKVLLKDIGLRIQLGHPNGVCPQPEAAFNNDFVIIAHNGVHKVSLDYCGCTGAPSKPIQLLRARLYPATVHDPKTAATFAVLEQFQLLSFTSKLSNYEYYRCLSRLTDNTGTESSMDRYSTFLRIVHQWRHVRLLKRMMRGHDESGVVGTAEGECAVLCPACPYEEKNLPENWKDLPENIKWIYTLFVGIDANFRLKRMNVSSDERDPSLNHGYSYMVERKKYKEHLDVYDQKIPDEKSNCNNHDAIKSASARGGHGTAASRLSTAECIRHDMKRKLAADDLTKGERYVNIDYVFLSSLQEKTLERLVVSYDIACQWSINLFNRCRIYPATALDKLSKLQITYLVPKFHLPAHIAKCQTAFSFNFTRFVGRTDGEAPERGWSASNGLASSTKEMGPGSRSDTLDDHFGDYNWRKIMQIAETFSRKAQEAHAARQEHVDAFVEFDAALPMEDTTLWTRMCQEWEKDPRKPNPFVVEANGICTDADVRLRLAEEDAAALARGDSITIHDDISPSMLIGQGLQLQENQARLAMDMQLLGSGASSLQKTKILEHSNALKRKIEAWINIQHLYMPEVAVLCERDSSSVTTPVSVPDIKLFLPSYSADTLKCSRALLHCKWEFRYAHAGETLNRLRGFLLLRSHLYKSKARYSRGVRQQTRSVKILATVETNIKETAKTYRSIRAALQRLSSVLLKVSWENILRPLEDSDVVGLSSMDDAGSEGRKRLSWIWKVHGTGENADACTQSALRIEWCKARARAHRWQEECLLLAEEMRRICAFFAWQQKTWLSLALKYEPTGLEGKVAYALRQADLRKRMRENCEGKWAALTPQLLSMEGRQDVWTMVECH